MCPPFVNFTKKVALLLSEHGDVIETQTVRIVPTKFCSKLGPWFRLMAKQLQHFFCTCWQIRHFHVKFWVMSVYIFCVYFASWGKIKYMVLHVRIRSGSDWWFSKILQIRTGSHSIFADQDWTRTEKFYSSLISSVEGVSQCTVISS